MTKPVEKTIHMTKRQWEKWDKALRSGKIKQTTSCLIDQDGAMCCLGVLEHALEGKVEADEGYPTRDFLDRNNIKFFNHNGCLEYHHHENYDDDLYDDDGPRSPWLTGGYANELNDDQGLSFKQIAERIKHRVKFIPEKKKVKK